ncbi:MAG: vWA domain-containing protein [Nanobdellota archaeon]
MDAIDRTIFFILALIVGGSAISLLMQTDLLGTTEIEGLTSEGETELEGDTVNLMSSAIDFWEKNQYAKDTPSFTMYVEGNTTFDKDTFFSYIRDHQLCNTIQSRSYDCGKREDVTVERIELPAVVRVQYKNETLHIGSMGLETKINDSIHYQLIGLPAYAGEGNLTRGFTLPPNATILSFEARVSAGADLNMTVNGDVCRRVMLGSDESIFHNLINCSPLLKPGYNEMTFRFLTGNLFRQQITGGYVLVVYQADTALAPEGSTTKIPLPAIDGTINLYDSLNLRDSATVEFRMDVDIETLHQNNFSLIVGNQTRYSQRITGSHTITETMSLAPGIHPFKLTVAAETELSKEIKLPLPTNVVLITDVSNSMACDTDANIPQRCVVDGDMGMIRGCSDVNLMAESTQKLSLAKCFGKSFAEIIINSDSKNKVGLVHFSTYVAGSVNPTSDLLPIKTAINTYNYGLGGGGTCIECALFKARQILGSISTNGTKVIVLMSDGKPTEVMTAGDPFTNALEQAQKAAAENISLYTIGFAMQTSEGRDFMQDVACFDNCSNYKAGDDPQALQDIYEGFAKEIAKTKTVYVRFTQGYDQVNWTPSSMRNGSYIKINYGGSASATHPAKALVSLSLDCEGEFLLPRNMSIEKAQLGVWSGVYWTDYAEINGDVIYDLGTYSSDYRDLGEPFFIDIPKDKLKHENELVVREGTIHDVKKQCPSSLELFYVARVNDSLYSSHHPQEAGGCHWTIQMEDHTREMTLPETYKGESFCFYTKNKIKYNPGDLHQLTAASVFKGLDTNQDGIVDSPFERMYTLGGQKDI